jgi:hypothetical protein
MCKDLHYLRSKFCRSENERQELLDYQLFIEYAILHSRPNNCTPPEGLPEKSNRE